jgi:hypothetical protein
MNGSAMSNSNDLLRRLEPAVRPAPLAHGGGSTSAAAALFESQPFDRLLAAAFAGEIRSDRPVQAACDLQPSLSAGQLERLSLAADRAEAGGARTALMMIDGRGIVVDVTGRMITSEMRADDVSGMLQIDAAMVVPQDESLPGSGSLSARVSSLLPVNPSVAKLLHDIEMKFGSTMQK